ncbi:MAG TPA: hypothetical protein VFR67_01520 [Pilimelia sp.]|nr:hypothetical protein [Pilimelia sp.]
MTDPVEHIARAAAARLAAQHGPALPVDVEAALHARGPAREPDRYVDPISLGALIVSVASLAWTVYTDLRQKTTNPSPEVLTRTIRVQLRDVDRLDPTERDRVIDVVVTETVNHRD